MTSTLQGQLRKMHTTLTNPVSYQLPLFTDNIANQFNLIDMNPLLGNKIKLEYTGEIYCCHCGRKTNKSFNQGYCFPCFRKLAQCDSCIIHPEKCHYHKGTCREPDWGDQHCMQTHIVYLANSSNIKVGITRHTQVPTRWIDQGAIQALPILSVDSRYQSGLAEVIFKNHVSDKTNWRSLLLNAGEKQDLAKAKNSLLESCNSEILNLQQSFGIQAITIDNGSSIQDISYPILSYPTKIIAHNFDKNPSVEGTLMGIKGQYLLLDTGVINIRKFTGYTVNVSIN